MSDRLTPPERFDIPDEHRHALRNIVLMEISHKRTSRRIGRRALAVTVALAVLTTVGIAGAALRRTELDPATEVFPENRAEAIARLAEGIPLPDGGSFDGLIDVNYTEDETGLAGTLAFNAWCQWTGSWIDGTVDNDPGQQHQATIVMRQVPTWPAIAATDGGGTSSTLTAIVTAAVTGDLDTVVVHYQSNCTGVDPDRDADLAKRWPLESSIPIDTGPICDDLQAVLADLTSEEATDPMMMLEQAVELAASGPEEFLPLVDLLEGAIESGDAAAALPDIQDRLGSLCGRGS
ncbi:MAG: hypothetical protein GXP35_12740 [Actinobacteria bacterium]|nr:hypothetical protein [Actinomycetota bacterium]